MSARPYTQTDWHPVQSLTPVEFYFPVPGTKQTFAILRYVDVTLDGEPVSRWRAVTWHEDPKKRRLIDDGYFRELEDAAMACHRAALHAAVRPELNRHGAYDQPATQRNGP